MNPRSGVPRWRRWRDALLLQEDLNFLLTNRVPRLALTRFMGWFSQIRHPWVRDASIAVWRAFTDLDLSDARKTRFDSLHDCFVRELEPGARPIDPDPAVLVSPCDAIVGECGPIAGLTVFQAKGFPYSLDDLFGRHAAGAAATFRDGCYATLRLTSAMYHRFHAPHDLVVRRVCYSRGDTWNVNPIALKRIERLFCKNERAAIHAEVGAARHPVAIVPVAAILVASLRLHWIDTLLHPRHRGRTEWSCDARFAKGDEMGWFQHGSTILVFAPRGFALADGVVTGRLIRMGQPLMRLPEDDAGRQFKRPRFEV